MKNSALQKRLQAQTERVWSPPQGSYSIMKKPSNLVSSRRNPSPKGTYGEYRTLRESKEQALSEGLQQISDSQNYQEQMHKLKVAFNKRFDAFVAKRKKAAARRLMSLGFAVMRAYLKKKRQDRREKTMSLFCQEKLRFLQLRRTFKCLKMFARWQQDWVRVVRANFKLKMAKLCFKQIYLTALKRKIDRAKYL